MGRRGPGTRAICPCFLGYIFSVLDNKWGSWDLSWFLHGMLELQVVTLRMVPQYQPQKVNLERKKKIVHGRGTTPHLG